MIQIQLEGFPEDKPKTVTVEATTYREALAALRLQPGFRPREETCRFESRVHGCKLVGDLDAEIKGDVVRVECFKVHDKAVMRGGGDNSFVQIIIGIVLIVVGVIATAYGYADLGAFLVNAGIALAVGGVVRLLTPRPDTAEEDEERSRVMGNFPNTVQSGTPIPLILGEHRWGGHLFSLNIESKEGADINLQDFVGEIWDEANVNRRDSWLTLYRSPGGNSASGSEYDGGGGGRRRFGNPLPLYDVDI